MDWIYLTLKNGKLLDDNGYVAIKGIFKNRTIADQYLIDNDIRASIR